ncbi:hypothetical protein [Agrobacterium tumefaciens]|uniref:hypothetical protein n=1 Tax=Agrobacterium tumefaciens TaxID=358 RepID=UPI001968A76A
MGYGGSHEDAARRLGKTGDGGIDGVIDEDRLGIDLRNLRGNPRACGKLRKSDPTNGGEGGSHAISKHQLNYYNNWVFYYFARVHCTKKYTKLNRVRELELE